MVANAPDLLESLASWITSWLSFHHPMLSSKRWPVIFRIGLNFTVAFVPYLSLACWRFEANNTFWFFLFIWIIFTLTPLIWVWKSTGNFLGTNDLPSPCLASPVHNPTCYPWSNAMHIVSTSLLLCSSLIYLASVPSKFLRLIKFEFTKFRSSVSKCLNFLDC